MYNAHHKSKIIRMFLWKICTKDGHFQENRCFLRSDPFWVRKKGMHCFGAPLHCGENRESCENHERYRHCGIPRTNMGSSGHWETEKAYAAAQARADFAVPYSQARRPTNVLFSAQNARAEYCFNVHYTRQF